VCGIAGFVLEKTPSADPRATLKRMADTLVHRGPEDEGFHESRRAFLAHRRLRIIDLEGGHQPQYNEDRNVAVVLNGEIYNFQDIKDGLLQRGHQFKTVSDTEVLVHLWEEMQTSLPDKLNGMFALAIWDERRRQLFLARDRLGKKPLYYSLTPEGFVFGSELKAVLAHPAVQRRLCQAAVSRYLLFDTVPAPLSIVDGVFKLEPGTWLLYQDGNYRIGRYWDMSFPGRDHRPPRFADAKEQFVTLLTEAVRRRLIADVPLGVFLSGGIDSSAVTALMCKVMGPHNVRTFSVGFEDASFDESEHARTVAAHLKTRHSTRRLDARTMLELLPGIISRLDEPLADNSLIPTYFLSGFTREHVTVALGGDGGDELCLGYPTFQAHRIARWYGWLPGFVRAAVRALVGTLPVSTSNISFDYKARQFVRGMEYDRLSRHFVWIGAVPPLEQSALLTPEFAPPDPMSVLDDIGRHAANCTPRDDFDLLTYLYSKIYMCDDILMKVDRASMMHALEVRAPLLDVNVVEFLTSLPTRYKLNGFTMKHLMKESFKGLLPDSILKRKKKGFGIPMADWLKGELRPLAEELFSPSQLARSGVFHAHEVHRLWNEHLTGTRDNRKPLWSLLVLLLWIQENLHGH